VVIVPVRLLPPLVWAPHRTVRIGSGPISVPPRSSCVNTLPRTAAAECVEVTGGHLGLVFNRKSYRAIAQALAAPGLAPGLPERPVASLV
jgi:hypothetical protein